MKAKGKNIVNNSAGYKPAAASAERRLQEQHHLRADILSWWKDRLSYRPPAVVSSSFRAWKLLGG